MSSKLRLGGMALSNGVLVHGPTAWACAIRTDEGEIKVTSARKRLFAPGVQQPFLRGPLRLAEAFAMIPELRRRLPEARLPFERPSVLAATLASALTVQVVRRSPKLGDAARELLSGALSLAPAMLALRGGELAAYHGAEHVSIGTVRARRDAGEGARALRLAPDRPTAGGVGGRQPASRRARRPICAARRGRRARWRPSASRSRCSPG